MASDPPLRSLGLPFELYGVLLDSLPVFAICLNLIPRRRLIRTSSCAMSYIDRRFQGRPDVATGTVKFFNSQKGFGFIQPDDGGKDVFVHISAVERAGMRSLNEGQKLRYDVVSERGKLAAANLQNV